MPLPTPRSRLSSGWPSTVSEALAQEEALRAQVIGAIQGPLSQLITLLTAPQAELVRVLEARSKGSNTEERQEAI